MIPVAVASEDALSEAIALRLVSEVSLSHYVTHRLRKRGSGYLRSKIKSWCEMARHQLMLVLTDLDETECAPLLRSRWRGGRIEPPGLLLRVAVREVESWALADHEALRVLVGRRGRLPSVPDQLDDPKQFLLALARLAPKAVRQDLTRDIGDGRIGQGLGYNARLVPWVWQTWQPERAAQRSPSLARTRIRLDEAMHLFQDASSCDE